MTNNIAVCLYVSPAGGILAGLGTNSADVYEWDEYRG